MKKHEIASEYEGEVETIEKAIRHADEAKTFAADFVDYVETEADSANAENNVEGCWFLRGASDFVADAEELYGPRIISEGVTPGNLYFTDYSKGRAFMKARGW